MFQEGKSSLPKRPGTKVRDLGREILKKANHCSWIGYMTEQAPPDAVQTRRKMASLMDLAEAVGDRIVKEDGLEVKAESPEALGEHEQSQLDLLRSLQDQQQKLMEQQRVLHDQIQRQLEIQMRSVRGSQRSTSGSTAKFQGFGEGSETCTPASSPRSPCRVISAMDSVADSRDESPQSTDRLLGEVNNPTRRRLKGSLAQTCALRDEGSLGSLIWSERPEEEPGERLSNFNWSSIKQNIKRESQHYIDQGTAPKSRPKSRRPPEGSAMSDLLAQSSSDLSNRSNMSSKTVTTLMNSSSCSSDNDTILSPNRDI